ncbi:MAG TPA: glycosyltransferase family A protein, partial [Paludibacter sp.]|nr:glycosyltransferase family A protein [Paludibacter sp.]
MTINCFIPYQNYNQTKSTIHALKQSPLIHKIYLFAKQDTQDVIDSCEVIHADTLHATATVKAIVEHADAPYSLIYTKISELSLGYFGLERMLQIAENTGAGMVYSDHYQVKNGKKINNPVVTYQKGSLRDDFNFGSVLLYKTTALKKAVKDMDANYQYAGLYDLRLKVSRLAELVHINEYLYTEIEHDDRKSGETIFDYVDPKNRAMQIEMEQACTDHLKQIGAYLKPEFKKVDFNQEEFEYEASVIIPVRNRIRTIADAIQSVLMQKTDFKFNLIVIDNYSTDGTTEAIDAFKSDKRLIHIIPDNKDLGIGGCWNVGVHHPKCGKFAVQLDSDDMYAGDQTLQKIVDAFYEQQCAMVVGSYMLTDFDKNPIPPGIIDHKEWTPENGRNNALRINGLGAPRAFFTPLLRKIKVPNTSYGEDYALGLAFSREYQIGRIYEVVYLCRRWEDNTDASLDIVKMN